MKKTLFFCLLLGVFFLGLGVNFLYAQTDPLNPGWWTPINLPSNNNQTPQWNNSSSNWLGLSDSPGYWYCSSISDNIPNIQTCLNCVQGWQTARLVPGWSIDCVPVEQLCNDAYSDPGDLESCNDTYTSCIDSWWSPDRCSCKAVGGVSLNTNVPFVGNCISLRTTSSSNTTDVTPTTAFPLLMAWLTRIVTTIILIFCFMAIIVGGVLMSMWWADESQHKKGKDLIKHVVIALALLWASGVILRIINPSFFG